MDLVQIPWPLNVDITIPKLTRVSMLLWYIATRGLWQSHVAWRGRPLEVSRWAIF